MDLQHHHIELFAQTFALCGLRAGDSAAVLSEAATRPELPQLAMLGLQRLGLRPFQLVMPGQPVQGVLPLRSTGASLALTGMPAAVAALAGCSFVADCTVEGLMHAAELPQILVGGARVLYVSHEHPETLERCAPQAEDEAPVRDAMRRLKSAREMTVSSAAGTALTIGLTGARVGGVWGFTTRPGTLSHWPGGLVLAFPAAGAVHGTLVLDQGDVNLGFKRYLESPVRLRIADDRVVAIDGDGLDAELMRSHYAAWDAVDGGASRAVSHIGWGLNRRARWEAMAYHDKVDCNGTELRAFAGNFLYSTGANEAAGRHTPGHFDLPMRGCTVALDGVTVVRDGVLA
ncbi:MAG: peptidase M29 [Rubrivivax sp.]|nr:peptidase M29 [Rubrivivax sp.]